MDDNSKRKNAPTMQRLIGELERALYRHLSRGEHFDFKLSGKVVDGTIQRDIEIEIKHKRKL